MSSPSAENIFSNLWAQYACRETSILPGMAEWGQRRAELSRYWAEAWRDCVELAAAIERGSRCVEGITELLIVPIPESTDPE